MTRTIVVCAYNWTKEIRMQTVRLGFRPENKWTGFITRDSKFGYTQQ